MSAEIWICWCSRNKNPTPLQRKASTGSSPLTPVTHPARCFNTRLKHEEECTGTPRCVLLPSKIFLLAGRELCRYLFPLHGWQQTNCRADLSVSLPAEQISSNAAGSLSGNNVLEPCSAINGSSNLLCSFETHRSIPDAWTVVLIWQMILL